MKDEFRTISQLSQGTYTELRSKFLAFAMPVSSAEEALQQVETFRRKYYDARHVCWAYMLGAERDIFRSNDDGEPSGTAGKPILGQINSMELTDVLVLVVRYFGGVKLGTSGLIVAYRTAAAEALAAAEIVERTVDVEYSVSFEYPLMNGVLKAVRESSARILAQTYDVDCTLRLAVRAGKLEELKQKIAKALSPY